MRIASTYLAYTNTVINELNNQKNKYLSNSNEITFYPVGSCEKQSDFQANINNKSIILASGKFFGSSRSFFSNGDPDLRIYKIHKSFISLSTQFTDKYKFIIKANNTPFFNHLPYKSSQNFSIDYKSKFIELLPKAKAIVLDTPGTTLLESSDTSVPIFAVLGRNIYTQSFLDISTRRIVWCKDHSELYNKLFSFLKNNEYEADIFNNDLKELYLGSNNKQTIWNNVEKIILNYI